MSVLMNDNFDIKAPKPTDARFGPYASTAEALAAVVVANRHIGLTVGVITAGVVEEYWWNDGTTDGDLTLKIGATGGGGGTVTSVGASAPVTSTGGTAPVIGMPAATAAVDGYLSAVNFTLFNSKQAPATTLAGYGITDAYTKTASDANYPTKAGAGATGTWAISISGTAAAAPWTGITGKPTTLSGYGITDAYTKVESDGNYPTKAGAGATGTWAISISGSAASATAVAWSGVTGKPTTLSGYGITDAYTKTQSDANYPTKAGAGATGTWGINISGSASSAASVPWTGVGSPPNTLAGYGITDAYTKIDSDARFLNLAGGTMTGAINWSANGQTAGINLVPDPLSSTGDVMNVESDAGVQVKGPYVVLDTTNLQITMPGAIPNAAITVAAIDAYGVVSLGYTQLPPPSYAVSDSTSTPVVIKAAGVAPPTAWISLGLSVTLAQDVPIGSGNIMFEGIFSNPTPRSGVVEFGLRINGGTVNARDIVTQIAPNFSQTIAMQLPLQVAYVDGDVLELMARVTTNDNNAFSLTMDNSSTDLGAMRIFTTPSSGTGGGGVVNSVGAVAPVVSTGGSDPQISMPAATASVSGYLSAANFTLFNGKQSPATTLAGYGITDAYTKTQSDANYPTKAGVGASGTWGISISGNAATASSAASSTTASSVAWSGVTNTPTSLVGYGITDAYDITATDAKFAQKASTLAGYTIGDAYTKTEADTKYPTKAGVGATGTWGISITGNAATATSATSAGSASSVPWTGVTTPPTTIAGYGITDVYSKTESDGRYPSMAGVGASGNWAINITGTANAALTANAAPWTGITGTPTTIAGYGITDAYTKAQTDAALANKQATLVNQVNIKSINGESLLGSGDIVVSGGSGGNADSVDGWSVAVVQTMPGVPDPNTIYFVEGDTGGGSVSVAWADITGTPSTLTGYGITDAYTKIQSDANYPTKAGVGATGNWPINVSGTAGAIAWGNITSKPTTIAGYAITDAYTKTEVDTAFAFKAPLASPVFTGDPQAPTPALNDNDTSIATTAYVKAQIANDAPGKTGTGASGSWAISITGSAGAVTWANVSGKPTTIAGYGITDAYTKTEVDAAVATKASLASPVFTGNPTAPTPTLNDNDTSIATTAYVKSQIANDAPTRTGSGASGSWAINVTGSAASCTGNAATASVATAVEDNGAGASIKMWYGTEAEFAAIVTKDPTTLYLRSA